MANISFPDGYPEPEIEAVKGKMELDPQMVNRYPLDAFIKGENALLIEDGDGKEIARLEINPKSNSVRPSGEGDVQSFNLTLSNGYKVLLGNPTEFNAESFTKIRGGEILSVELNVLGNALNFPKQHFNLQISDNGVIVKNISPEKEYCSLAQTVTAPKIRLKSGESGLYWKNETAGNGVYSGKINGGHPVYAATAREIGVCDKYPFANEDNIGIGLENGRMVLVDGMGGGVFGECASSLIVEAMLNSKEHSLERNLQEAHDRLYIYDRHLYFTSGTFGNAVMAAVQVNGDSFEAVSLGDCRWWWIRKGKIIQASPVRSPVGEQYAVGLLSLAEALNHPQRSVVDTSMVGNYRPDVFSGTMSKGDFFVLADDGMAVIEREMLKILSKKGLTPAKAAKSIIATTRQRNISGIYDIMENRKKEMVPAPKDNMALIIYSH